MKYLLLVYSPESSWTPEEWQHCVVESSRLCHQLAADGKFQDAAPLHPVATALTVRVRDHQSLVTAGPYAETTEQLGGYFLIDVEHLDDALSIAAQLPAARRGTIEVRPLFPLDQMPEVSSRWDDQKSEAAEFQTFVFLCYDDEAAWKEQGEAKHRAAMHRARDLVHAIHQRGQYLFATPLRDSETATCVRIRDHKTLVTDGPFAETREVIGGIYLVKARSQQEAMQWAEQHPGAELGGVEVRQVVDIPQIPVPNDRQILSFRDLEFPLDQVRAAFSDPALLATWWGPNGFRNSFQEFDFREQGNWRLIMHGPDGKDYPNHWIFHSLGPRRLEWEHCSEPHFHFSVSLTPLFQDQTRLVWLQTFRDARIRDQVARFAIDANQENFDRLIRTLQQAQVAGSTDPSPQLFNSGKSDD